MGSIKYLVIILLLLAGNAQAATVIGQAKFTNFSTNTWGAIRAGGGGGGTPAVSVVAETTYGAASAVGTGTNYARQDHTHGTPATVKDTTAITGILKGNGSAISAATVATDYSLINGTGFVKSTGTTLSYDASAYLTTAGAAASATASAITNDTTTATSVYPNWVTAAGSAMPEKISTTKLSFVPSTGTLTATNFSGILSAGSIATGVTAATQATNDSSTKIATTAYYTGQAGTANPAAEGTAAPGTSLLFSRSDHVHPASSGIGAIYRVTGSNYTNATTTPSNITGLGWSIAANAAQYFKCWLPIINSNAGSALRLNINGPATPTLVNFVARTHTTSATTWIELMGTAFSATAQTTSVTASVITTAMQYTVEGVINNGANAGTVQLMGAGSGAFTSTIYIGAFCEVY
jgi:hypothetical protein